MGDIWFCEPESVICEAFIGFVGKQAEGLEVLEMWTGHCIYLWSIHLKIRLAMQKLLCNDYVINVIALRS